MNKPTQNTPREAAIAAANVCHGVTCFRCNTDQPVRRVKQHATGLFIWMHKDEFCVASAQRESLIVAMPEFFGAEPVPVPVTASVGGPVIPLTDADVSRFNALEADPNKVEELTTFCAALEAKHGTIDWCSLPVKVTKK